MADIWSGKVGNNYCPQIHLVVSLAADNADHVILNWYADYVAHGYAAYTNGVARSWAINIDGHIRNGTVNINGQAGTIRLGSGQIRANKLHNPRNVGLICSMVMDFTWNGSYLGDVSGSGSQSIGQKASYKVSYNANGGSGAPANQTKWYGENLVLSGTKPSRAGHDFAGWATSASGNVAYQPGSTYTGNATLTLYAKWIPHTYTVTYNANGGSGAPSNQTKTYGQDLKLSTTIPTRKNYNFLGWGTSANSTTVTYAAGANYTNDSAITLYAVWELAWLEPRITNLKADRCDSAGTLSEEGMYAKVTFGWATDRTVSSIKIVCNGVTTNPTATGTSGSVSVVIGANALSTEQAYPVNVTVADSVGGVTISTTVAPMDYIMDIAPNGSVSFGAPANPSSEKFDVHIPALFKKPVMVSAESTFDGVQNVNDNVYMKNNIALCGKTTSGSNVDILRLNSSNLVELNWTSGGLRGRCGKVIWSGNWFSGKITIPEAMYYNVFSMKFSDDNAPYLIGIRQNNGDAGSLITFYGIKYVYDKKTPLYWFATFLAQSESPGNVWVNKGGGLMASENHIIWGPGQSVSEIRGLL